MAFEELKANQPEVVRIIDNSYNRKRLVHAYIFEGETGSGKYEACQYMAAKLLCRENNRPCGNCDVCKRILNSNHLNVNVIEPVEGTIKKEQVSALLKEVSMKTLETGSRIHIIKEADMLNQSSSNALLKFLEEPYPNHYIILTTTNINRILDTIISRCQILHFRPLRKDQLEEKLVQKGIERDVAYVLACITSNEKKADELIADGEIINIIEMVKKLFITENLQKDKYVSFLISAKKIEKKDFAFNQLFLEIYTLFLEEKINYLNEPSFKHHFTDIFTKMDPETEDVKKVIKQLDTICEYEERLNNYPNIDLFYASMFIKL